MSIINIVDNIIMHFSLCLSNFRIAHGDRNDVTIPMLLERNTGKWKWHLHRLTVDSEVQKCSEAEARWSLFA